MAIYLCPAGAFECNFGGIKRSLGEFRLTLLPDSQHACLHLNNFLHSKDHNIFFLEPENEV